MQESVSIRGVCKSYCGSPAYYYSSTDMQHISQHFVLARECAGRRKSNGYYCSHLVHLGIFQMLSVSLTGMVLLCNSQEGPPMYVQVYICASPKSRHTWLM